MKQKIKALDALDEIGVKSLSCLKAIIYLNTPRSVNDIESATGFERSSLRKFMIRNPGLIKKRLVKNAGTRRAGNNIVEYTLSAKLKMLIKPLL
jgi:hypothetical protein